MKGQNFDERVIQESRNIQAELRNSPDRNSYEEIVERILKPYFSSTKDKHFENENNRIEFVEIESSDFDKELLNYYLNHLYSRGRADSLLMDPREWCLISKLKYTMTETEIDISKIFPECKVFSVRKARF